VTFRRGERIQRPEGTGPSWYLTALSQVRREALGDTPIRFELNGSPDVVGRLDRPNTVVGPLGTVVLADGVHVAAQDIEAFTLLPDPELEEDRGE
jgi:hypothetical protein